MAEDLLNDVGVSEVYIDDEFLIVKLGVTTGYWSSSVFDPLFEKENVGATEKIGGKTNVVLRDIVDLFNDAENDDETSDNDENWDVTNAELELEYSVRLVVVYWEYDEFWVGISSLTDDVLVFSKDEVGNVEDKIGNVTLLELSKVR